MIRYRAMIGVDLFVDEYNHVMKGAAKSFQQHDAQQMAQKIAEKIPNSWVEEVKPLPHGSENILSKENKK